MKFNVPYHNRVKEAADYLVEIGFPYSFFTFSFVDQDNELVAVTTTSNLHDKVMVTGSREELPQKTQDLIDLNNHLALYDCIMGLNGTDFINDEISCVITFTPKDNFAVTVDAVKNN